MISIIIIGHNEGWRLSKCLSSISEIVKEYKDLNFEVLYVDSRSSDDSVERVKNVLGIKIYELSGKMNAAIARNVGAQESSGDILFFVDGDMELKPIFLNHALNEKGELKYDALTGHLDDYFYDIDGKFITASPRTYSNKIPIEIQKLKTNGGIFLIKKSIWCQLFGMKTKYKINEDIDLSIRLKKAGVITHRLPYLITNHHTIDYRNEKRMWKMLWAGNGFYPGLLFRDHFFNENVLKRIIRSEYTALLLLTFLLFLFVNRDIFKVVGAGYILLLALRTIIHTRKAKSGKNIIAYFFERYILQIFLDISFWIGFFFFYPQNSELKYKPLY